MMSRYYDSYFTRISYKKHSLLYAWEVYSADTDKYLGLITNCRTIEDAISKAEFIYGCSVRVEPTT